jgi:hypothetical protein
MVWFQRILNYLAFQPFASTEVHPRFFSWVRVAHLSSFKSCPIMCLYVQTSMLWCPLRFRIKTMFGSSLPPVIVGKVRSNLLYWPLLWSNNLCYVSWITPPFNKQTLEKTEGAIQNGQSRETVNIEYTRHRTKKTKAKNIAQKTKTMRNLYLVTEFRMWPYFNVPFEGGTVYLSRLCPMHKQLLFLFHWRQ